MPAAPPAPAPPDTTGLLPAAGIAASLWVSAFVDWRLVHGEVDIPVGDLLAMGIAAIYGLWVLAGRLRQRGIGGIRGLIGPLSPAQPAPAQPPLALPAMAAWSAFLAACLLCCWLVEADGQMVYFVARKPLFCWVVYGAGVAGVVRFIPAARLLPIAFLHAAWLAGLILPPALWLVINGYAGAILDLPGLINNHKVFAVALAPWLGALWQWRALLTGRWSRYAAPITALAGAAVIASMSKAAWITAAISLGAFIPWRGRPLLARPLQVVALTGSAFLAMIALPLVTGSADMADSLDSRWSLNVRAWIMFSGRPWYGWGPGTATRWLMNDPRHYRIDGVDAHGVIQKVGSEIGLLGLVPYLAAYGWFFVFFWRAAMEGGALRRGAAILGIGLQLNLLLSTDYFSGAHWMPLAVAVGLVARNNR